MLTLTPINLKTANAFVQQHHRHHKPTRGHKFSIGVSENGSSLKAAGYTCEGRAGGLEWNGAKAPKQADQYPRQMKTRWVKKKEGLHGS